MENKVNSKTSLFEKIKDELRLHLDDKSAIDEIVNPGDEMGLINRAMISEAELLKTYAAISEIKIFDAEDLNSILKFEKITLEYLQYNKCIPISWDDEGIIIAIAEPYHRAKISRDIKITSGKKSTFILARMSVIERLQNTIYDAPEEEKFSWDSDGSEQSLQNLAKEAPVVRFVNDTFSRALDMEASDIHIEALADHFVVRNRVDGLLQIVSEMPINMFPAVNSRIKLIGGMNIAEHRLPQDGRTELQIGRNQIDVRISTVPSTEGESIVMRILRKDVQNFSLRSIGMSEEIEDRFKRVIGLPHGIVLVVGPTGSGKSTTLYCSMNILNTSTNKILTVEDPVEYQIKGITQVHVKQSIGLTFASALRAFLRQDPDIILVGEIRDRETAEIAINAALTGHLVLSTLHTNDAAGAISRLQDMNVENFLISSSLAGVLSQRLVRRLCPACHGSGISDEDDKRKCRTCGGSGFKGRVGIFEFMEIDEELRRAINANKDSSEIARIAKKNGMVPLKEYGEKIVKAGVTTDYEVSRVCKLDL